MDYSQQLSVIADLLRVLIFSSGVVGGLLFIGFIRGRWF